MSATKPTIKQTILLVDNGSTRVDATLHLRKLAQQLSIRTGKKVHPVSLKHSNRIAIADVKNKLAGITPKIFTDFITERLKAGERDFILIPLFFGNSKALTSFVPDEKDKLETQFGLFNLNMAEVLYPLPKGDPIIVNILYEHALATARKNNQNSIKNLVLVDHGSPTPTVNAVRQDIAKSLNAKLPEDVHVNQAAMERREGKEYDFNGELLETYLNRLAKAGETQANVLLLFLLPGTHAGENGDIAQICNKVLEQYPDFKISVSPLISQNGKLIDCLEQRLTNIAV